VERAEFSLISPSTINRPDHTSGQKINPCYKTDKRNFIHTFTSSAKALAPKQEEIVSMPLCH